MRPISINLARRPFYNRTLYLVVYGVCAGVILVMTVLNVYTFIADRIALGHLADARSALQQEMGDLDREEARIRRSLQNVRLGRLELESQFAQDALLQRYFSWTRLFNRLEQVTPPDAKLRSIRPIIHPDHIEIRVTGTAKSPEAFTEFEEALIASPVFSDVYPGSELWLGQQRGLQFDLGFRYVPSREPDAGEGGESPPEPPANTASAVLPDRTGEGGAS